MALEDANNPQGAGLGDQGGQGDKPPEEVITQQSLVGTGEDAGQGNVGQPPDIPEVVAPDDLDETGKEIYNQGVKAVQSAFTQKLQAAAQAQRDLEAANAKVADLETQVERTRQSQEQFPQGLVPGQPGYQPGYQPGGYQQPGVSQPGTPPAGPPAYPAGQFPAQGPQVDPIVQGALNSLGNPDNLYDVEPNRLFGAIRDIARQSADEAQRPVYEAVWNDKEMASVDQLKKDWPAYKTYENEIEQRAQIFLGLPREEIFFGVAGRDLVRMAYENGRKQGAQETPGPESVPQSQKRTPATQAEAQALLDKAARTSALPDWAKHYEQVVDTSEQS